MKTVEFLNNEMTDPTTAINVILNNNPEAVAQRAVSIGLFNSPQSPQTLIEAINDLIRQGDIKSIIRLLSVPFNPTPGNSTDQYSALFEPYKGAKNADGSQVDWWTVVGSALIGGLTNIVGQTGPNTGAQQQQAQTNQQTQQVQNETGNTIITVVLVVFGVVVLSVVTYFIVKASKG